MAKLSDYREVYYEATATASDISRQAAYAGIALIWLFCNLSDGFLSIPKGLLLPIAMLIIGLLLDIFQYLYKSILWGWFCRNNESKCGTEEDPELSVPTYYNWPTLALFWLKILAVILAYLLVLIYVFEKISVI